MKSTLIKFGVIGAIIAAVVIYVQTQNSTIDDLKLEVAQLQGKYEPDTIYAEGEIIYDTTTVLKKSTFVLKSDTVVVNDTVYITETHQVDMPPFSIKGQTAYDKAGIRGLIGCLAHYPSGKMDFTIGLYKDKPKARLSVFAMLMGGVQHKKAVAGVGGGIGYGKWSVGAMALNDGIAGMVIMRF